jgi:two-component system sensor kinase FixL
LTAQDDGVLRITVIDNGPGFPSDVLERLFEPFVTTKANGLGLGLSICRSIIGAHGGRVSARNTDRGALLEITLPVAAL